MSELSVEEFAIKVKEITDLGVGEIIRHSKECYSFRISTVWYEVSYINNYGKSLHLIKGESVNTTTELICETVRLLSGSELRKQGDALLESLERIYVAQSVFQNEKVINSLKKYIAIISRCKSIEKLSNNVFTLIVDETKFIFELTEKYNNIYGIVYPHLEVKHFINNEEQSKRIDDYDKINSIFAVLNAIYYLNKTKDNRLVENDILNLFD